MPKKILITSFSHNVLMSNLQIQCSKKKKKGGGHLLRYDVYLHFCPMTSSFQSALKFASKTATFNKLETEANFLNTSLHHTSICASQPAFICALVVQTIIMILKSSANSAVLFLIHLLSF